MKCSSSLFSSPALVPPASILFCHLCLQLANCRSEFLDVLLIHFLPLVINGALQSYTLWDSNWTFKQLWTHCLSWTPWRFLTGSSELWGFSSYNACFSSSSLSLPWSFLRSPSSTSSKFILPDLDMATSENLVWRKKESGEVTRCEALRRPSGGSAGPPQALRRLSDSYLSVICRLSDGSFHCFE